jgi:hypothetical protein
MDDSPGETLLHAKTALLSRCSLEHAFHRLQSCHQLGKRPRPLRDYSTKNDHWTDGQRVQPVLHQWTRLAYPARGGFAYLPVNPRSTNGTRVLRHRTTSFRIRELYIGIVH